MDSKEKFNDKVSEYRKYRPDYPSEFINYLIKDVGIHGDAILADIGAGTGILTQQLGNKVKKIWAVEPNRQMGRACQEYCSDLGNFTLVGGSAEETGLPNQSVDYITAAQAFHWFDKGKTKSEFQRILKSHGKVILVWNSREPESELISENEKILKNICPEYKGFSDGSTISPNAYDDFFKNGQCEYKVFGNDRFLTLESFIGGSLSASYAPRRTDDNYPLFVKALTDLFNRYSKQGKMLLPYQTRSYVGQL